MTVSLKACEQAVEKDNLCKLVWLQLKLRDGEIYVRNRIL